MSFCQSCTMPLDSPDAKGPSDIYCKYCTDEEGNLKPREEIKKGIASWLKSLQEGITDDQALKRAEHFMQAMPAWAED
ncbi:MAG: zinc ribbon domain-containing protein [Candidatus Methanofastidiosia archaeon]